MTNHWQEALYSKRKKISIEDEYLYDKRKNERTEKMFDWIEKRIKLDENSKIIELGCNLARNLRSANRRYGSHVTGYDINAEVIEKDRKFFGVEGDFYVSDLRASLNKLAGYKDNHFDLGLTMGFLMHIPQGDIKSEMINHFLRICKAVCFYELSDDINSPDQKEENEYVLTSEDYRKYNNKIKLVTDMGSGRLRFFFYSGQNWDVGVSAHIQ